MTLAMLMVFVVAVADLVITVALWRLEKKRCSSVVIPSGAAQHAPNVNGGVDLAALLASVNEKELKTALDEMHGKAADEGVEVKPDDMARVLAMLGKEA